MGYRHYRHLLRLILRGSGVAIVGSVLIDEVSGGTIAATIPASQLNARYSRQFEAQPDDFALDALMHADVSPAVYVRMMQAPENAHPKRKPRRESSNASTRLLARDRHSIDQDRPGEERRTAIDIAADGENSREHLAQVAGDGDFVHRICDLAILDPKTGRAARVIAGDD